MTALARRRPQPLFVPAADALGQRDDDRSWLREGFRNTPLFEVPWEGNAVLRPIRTTRTLKDASEVFGAGVWQRLDWYLDGQEASYLTQNGTQALVTLRADPLFGWTVREVVGAGGGQLPEAVEAALLAQLALAGFRRRGRALAA